MRILAWNLNHRANRRSIPNWIVEAIGSQEPDVVVLTEYVEGDDHERFVLDLKSQGLQHTKLSSRTDGQNQVLISSRELLRRGELIAPPLHRAVPSNALHVVLEETGMSVLGFRMPAFTKKEDRPRKRETWQWLLKAAQSLRDSPAAIVGDFNTAPGDTALNCGDCLDDLTTSGWQHARPASGHSWKHMQYGTTRQIDHLFLSPALPTARAEYLWTFQSASPDAASGRVGIPDHAMLVADLPQ